MYIFKEATGKDIIMLRLPFYLQDRHEISSVLWGFFPGLNCSNYFFRLTLGAKRIATW